MGERRSGGSAVPLAGRAPPNTGDGSSAFAHIQRKVKQVTYTRSGAGMVFAVAQW